MPSCSICVEHHRSAEICAELDWTRFLRRRELVFLSISRPKLQCRSLKRGAGDAFDVSGRRQWLKQPGTRLNCHPADGTNDMVVANSHDSYRKDAGNKEEEEAGIRVGCSDYVLDNSFSVLPEEVQRARECPVERLHELLLVAQQELENARANSAKLEEAAQSIAEEAFAVMDQAGEAETAASDALRDLEITAKEEARLEDALGRAKVACIKAGVKVMLAEDALAEVLDKLNADQSDKAIRHFRTSVACYPAELPPSANGLTVEGSLGDVDSAQEYSGSAGALSPSDEDALEVLSCVNVSNEFTLTSEVQSGRDERTDEEEGGIASSSDDAFQALAVEKGDELSRACMELKSAEGAVQKLEDDLARSKSLKVELLKLTTHLTDVARQIKAKAKSAHDDAAYAMSLAENAVAWEVEAAQRLSDAEMALQKAETHAADAAQVAASLAAAEMAQRLASQVTKASEALPTERNFPGSVLERTMVAGEVSENASSMRDAVQTTESSFLVDSEGYGNTVSASNNGFTRHVPDAENKMSSDTESDNRKPDAEGMTDDDSKNWPKVAAQVKRTEAIKESASPGVPKAVKRSSRFFSASYFSFAEDGAKFLPSSLLSGLGVAVKQQLPKIVIAVALLLAG